MTIRQFLLFRLSAAVLATLFCGNTALAAATSDYSSNLATLYGEYQRVLAVRDACLTLQPGRRELLSEAYQDWFARHVRIIDDLDNRFAAIVKRASKDQADYSRNYGKYQSEVYQMRDENKKTLLAERDKLANQCDEFPAYLRHPKSDIPALFPAAFKGIYRPR